jgi:hypothetical protein
MIRTRAIHLAIAAALAGLAACTKDSTSPSTLIDDSQVASDVATSAGDAIATDVATMLGDDANAALPAPGIGFDLFGANPDSLATDRTHTCYDASAVAVTNCLPMSSVRTIVFHVTMNGTRTTATFTAAVHRTRDWTLTRLFTGSTETARRHDGVGTGNDTSVVSGALATSVTRTHSLTAVDSVVAVVFNLPRATNPWPASGTMVRRVAVHVVFAGATAQASRDYLKRVEVDFPADAQGNVVLKIDAKTCNLNLVTRAVTNCL